MGKFPGKGYDDEMVYSATADDFVFAFLQVDEFQAFAVRMDDQPGMGIKGYHNGFAPGFPGLFSHNVEYLLMAQVNAVECAHRYNGIGHGLKKVYVVIYFQMVDQFKSNHY